MKEKKLTITIETNGGVITKWGEGVTAQDVVEMCEFAEGEAQFMIEEEEGEE